jgi:hypothetical protein
LWEILEVVKQFRVPGETIEKLDPIQKAVAGTDVIKPSRYRAPDGHLGATYFGFLSIAILEPHHGGLATQNNDSA